MEKLVASQRKTVSYHVVSYVQPCTYFGVDISVNVTSHVRFLPVLFVSPAAMINIIAPS
jgi:hypothetical protein